MSIIWVVKLDILDSSLSQKEHSFVMNVLFIRGRH